MAFGHYITLPLHYIAAINAITLPLSIFAINKPRHYYYLCRLLPYYYYYYYYTILLLHSFILITILIYYFTLALLFIVLANSIITPLRHYYFLRCCHCHCIFDDTLLLYATLILSATPLPLHYIISFLILILLAIAYAINDIYLILIRHYTPLDWFVITFHVSPLAIDIIHSLLPSLYYHYLSLIISLPLILYYYLLLYIIITYISYYTDINIYILLHYWLIHIDCYTHWYFIIHALFYYWLYSLLLPFIIAVLLIISRLLPLIFTITIATHYNILCSHWLRSHS